MHGLGSRGADLERVGRALGRDRQWAAPDLRGHGAHPQPLGLRGPRTHARDLAAHLDELGWERCVVAGISLGGMSALELGRLLPERIAAVVALHCRADFRWHRRGRAAAFARWFFLPLLRGRRGAGCVLARRFFPAERQAPFRVGFERAWTEVRLRTYLLTHLALTAWSVESALHRFPMPVLFAGAERDAIARSEFEALARATPRGEAAWLSGLGHASTVEDPRRVAGLIGDFLDRHRL